MYSTQSDIDSDSPCGPSELEAVLTGRNINRETEPLLHHKPRNSCGVYNKINYLSLCYNLCWLQNGRHGLRTQRLLCFGGGFSTTGSILASLMVCVFSVLPLAAVWPFLYEKYTLTTDYLYTGLLIFTTTMELALFFWHFYCVYIIKNINYGTWVASWFTFAVTKEVLENETENIPGSLSLFDVKGKLRVVDVTVTGLCRLNSQQHQITVNEREKLATRIEQCRLDEAAVILYSQEFINEFVMHSMYGAFILASLSAASFALLLYKTIISCL